jgi:hypothetical protein
MDITPKRWQQNLPLTLLLLLPTLLLQPTILLLLLLLLLQLPPFMLQLLWVGLRFLYLEQQWFLRMGTMGLELVYDP